MDLEQVGYLIHPHHGSNCPSGADITSRMVLGFGDALAHPHSCSETRVAAEGSKDSLCQCSSISQALHLNLHTHLFVLEIFYVSEKYSCIKHGSPSRDCNSQHKGMVRTRSHSIPPGLCQSYIPKRKLRSQTDPGIWWVVKAMHAVDRATVPLTQVVVAQMLLCLGLILSHSSEFNRVLL